MATTDRGGFHRRDDGPLCDKEASRADRRQPNAGWRGLVLGVALALAAPAAAQTPTAPPPAKADARTLALAAGWKALFLCSGIFVAGLTEEQVEATDLQGGYPELQPHLAGLKAEVDRARMVVQVPFDAKLPPRFAWFTGQGCAQFPIGMRLDALDIKPRDATTEARPFLLALPELAKLDARPWPLGDGNAVAPPARKTALDAAVAAAFAGTGGQGTVTSAVLVVRDGRIIAERYGLGFGMHTPQRTWSVAKSLTSALIGRAQMIGRLDVSKRTSAFWPGFDPRASITVDQLLRMQSGLWTEGPGSRTDALYFGGATVEETAMVAPLVAAPGTRFNYANNDTLLAAHVLQGAPTTEAASPVEQTDPDDRRLGFAFAELLLPLGMTRTVIENDWRFNPILSSQVWMTARDMARLALLHLNDGQVPDGKGGMVRLLPEGWVKDATTPVGPQPDGDMGYGRAVWLMGPKQGLPEGTYAFLGNRGQMAIIVPSERLVVVRRGFDPHGVRFDGPALVRDVLAALGSPSPSAAASAM